MSIQQFTQGNLHHKWAKVFKTNRAGKKICQFSNVWDFGGTVLCSEVNTADEKAALSWPDLAWEVAGRMKQSHPKSWLPHLSGKAAAPTVGCQHQPEEGLAGVLSQFARKTAFNLENWSSSGEEEKKSVLLFLFILIEREWFRAYSIIIIIIQALTLICYDFIISLAIIRLATVSKAEIHF